MYNSLEKIFRRLPDDIVGSSDDKHIIMVYNENEFTFTIDENHHNKLLILSIKKDGEIIKYKVHSSYQTLANDLKPYLVKLGYAIKDTEA